MAGVDTSSSEALVPFQSEATPSWYQEDNDDLRHGHDHLQRYLDQTVQQTSVLTAASLQSGHLQTGVDDPQGICHQHVEDSSEKAN